MPDNIIGHIPLERKIKTPPRIDDLFGEEMFSATLSAKALGAYYTDAQVADFLVWWAIRSPESVVLDPSFGGGTFLRAAAKRIKSIGGQPEHQIYGVEIDSAVHTEITRKVLNEFHVKRDHLILSDFFEISEDHLPAFDAVIGNPPFIRYQRFSGDVRKLALDRARRAGVRISQLTSSWAPFLVHGITMLKEGGRLGMVLPMEIGYATYARPVMEFLSRSFETVHFLTFQKRLFPDLNEETILILGNNKGAHPTKFYVRDYADPGNLTALQNGKTFTIPKAHRLNETDLLTGKDRLVEYLLPPAMRDLYKELKSSPLTQSLGSIADVGIGYVTGNNDFFHLSEAEVSKWRIPAQFLKPAVRRGKALQGLCFSQQDWQMALGKGDSGYLLHIENSIELPSTVQNYLKHGQQIGVSDTFKCRNRSPWYRVPNVYLPDAFLTYMSSSTPRLVANATSSIAPNTLHILRLHKETTISALDLAAIWQTSLTRLSVEIEGHSMGGGLLKLEPTEAEAVIVPRSTPCLGKISELALELDATGRAGHDQFVQMKADCKILMDGLGLSRSDCKRLADAALILRERRCSRK